MVGCAAGKPRGAHPPQGERASATDGANSSFFCLSQYFQTDHGRTNGKGSSMKAAIYTRVSTEDKLNGHSLEAQARLASQFCELGVGNCQGYEERGRPGKNVFRSEFQESCRMSSVLG